MRQLLLSLAIVLLPVAPALAQVTVNLHALDALPNQPQSPAHRPLRPPVAAERPVAPAKPAAVAATPPAANPSAGTTQQAAMPHPPTAPSASASAPPSSTTTQRAAIPAQAPAAVPTVPAAPPAVAAIPPVQPPPAPANVPPPAAPPISASAATSATSTKAGLQLTFAKDQTELSPDSAASIKQLVGAAPNADSTTFNVLAYASGDPDDPSTARRLSLSRAIAVREALMADGVPSTRIYLRALGSEPSAGSPPDRVELDVQGGNSAAAARQ